MNNDSSNKDDLFAELLVELDEQLRGPDSRAPDASVIADDPELLADWEADRRCLELLHRVRRDWTPLTGLETPRIANAPTETSANGGNLRLGRFETQCKLGQGGLGIVYLGYDPKLRRQVALKVPRTESLISDDLRRRFLREAEAASRLSHVNLVRVYEIGEDAGLYYIAAEFCPGPNLAEWLQDREGPVALTQAARIVQDLALGVQHAHGRGVLHRDIKPSNVMMTKASEAPQTGPAAGDPICPKLTDFGMAKLLEREGMETRSGTLVGTPAYMAPEQAQGKVREVDARTDVYALGALLYEILTGHRVFESESDVEALRRVLFEDPIPPRRWRKDISPDLEAICLKCLAKQPELRYVTAQALADDLGRYLAGLPTAARPVSAVGHVVKWARRRPALASLACLAVVSTVALMGTNIVYNARLSDEARRSQLARTVAERETRTARQLLYTADVRVAYETFKANDVVQALAILDRHVPESGQEDLREFSWYHLRAQCDPTTLTLEGHQGDVFSVAYSPDGRWLATAGKDRTVRLWDAGTGDPLHVLTDHTSEVTCVAFAPDGKTLASGSEDTTIRLWDVESGKPLATWAGHRDHVLAIAYSPDGRWLASGSRDMTVQIRDAKSGELQHTLAEKLEVVRVVRFTTAGDQLLAGDELGQLHVWRTADWSQVTRRQMRGQKLFAVAANRDGTRIVAGGRRRFNAIWSVDGSEIVGLPEFDSGHNEWVQSLAFSPVDDRLASGGKDAIVQIARLGDAAPPRTLKGHRNRVWCVAWSPDGSALASASADGTVRLWNLSRRAEFKYPAAGVRLRVPVFSPDGASLYTVGGDGFIHTWNLNTRSLTGQLEAVESASSFRPSADGTLLAIRSTGGAISVLSSTTFEEVYSYAGESTFHCPIVWLPSGRRVASTSDKQTAVVLDVDARKIAKKFTCNDEIRSFVCTPDGRQLLTTTSKSMDVWDLATGQRVQSSPGSFGELIISNDGATIAAVSGRNNVVLFEANASYRAAKLVNVGQVSCLTFSPDGKTLALGVDYPRLLTLWDVRTRQQLMSFESPLDATLGVAFSPDGRRLIATGSNASSQGQIVEWANRDMP